MYVSLYKAIVSLYNAIVYNAQYTLYYKDQKHSVEYLNQNWNSKS